MTTITTNQWEINGVIDTSQSVTSNLNAIANASGCFLTWDAAEGTWSVVINDAGSSVYSFDDSNIIGNINVSGSGINELYNAVTIEFPHKDLRDATDYIDLKIPTADRYAQELDNVLTITTELVNDPIQAALIASRELKQSRLDKIVEFRTNYVANGLKAGDLIDITNTVYGYTSKVFRIIQIEEEDAQDGNLIYSIKALEYDADVYSTDGLERTYRSKKTGIVPKAQNTAITQSEGEASANELGDILTLLGPTAFLALLNGGGSGTGGIPYINTFTINTSVSAVQSAFNTFAGTPGFGGPFTGSSSSYVLNSFSLAEPVKRLQLTVTTPLSEYQYAYRYVTSVYNATEDIYEAIKYNAIRSGVLAYVPVQILLYYGATLVGQFTSDWQSNTITIPLDDIPSGNYSIIIYPIPTYDLDQVDSFYIYPYNHTIQPNTAGAGITVTGQALQI